MKKFLTLLLLSTLVVIGVFSQENNTQNIHMTEKESPSELITDRPDQTESSITVPKKTLQIETGFVYENFKEDDAKFQNWGLGTTLLRYGVWDNFELRLGSSYQQSKVKFTEMDTDSTQSGIGPLAFGFKVFIIEEKGIRPQISFLADLTLNNFGKTDYRPSYTYSTLKFAASHTLSNFFSLGYNFGYANNGEDGNGFFVYSLVLGMGITDHLGAYAEIYGTSANGDAPIFRYDGGFTFLLRNNLQLDLSAGSGIDKDVNMYYVSFGLTWRIPK